MIMFETIDIIIILIILVNIALTYFLKSNNSFDDQFQKNREETNKISKENREELSNTLEKFEDRFSKNIKNVQETIDKQLKAIRDDSTKQLDKMRNTVDEKLQTTLEKRLGESFKQVSERLEKVHKGLGEMQSIASGVGDLKKVLSNVKTRGVFGEYQLENILEQILSRDQYDKNVSTKQGEGSHVEFAIKLPGKDSDEQIWLPVDSKFPIEPYEQLNNISEDGSKEDFDAARTHLIKQIEGFAKTISEKYIDPPYTTNFAIMFLPVEGLYAEVLKEPGFVNTLQSKYRITITGPTTLSAFLNSLQMGFRTLAIQKQSSAVWKILEAVKSEFGEFSKQLDLVDKQLNTASKSLSTLRTTRTNVMSRKLRDVDKIESKKAKDILELPEVSENEDNE